MSGSEVDFVEDLRGSGFVVDIGGVVVTNWHLTARGDRTTVVNLVTGGELSAEIIDTDRIYSTEELAPGEEITFSCTGVTSGELLRGVRFFGGGSRTSTLVMSQPGNIVRFVDTIHQEEPGSPVHFY